MKRLLSALLLTAATAAHAAPEHELWVHGEIVVGPQGEVRDYTLDAGLKPVLAKLVADNVARWRFEPILVDGKPVVAKTRMTLTLAAREQDNGDVELRVDDVAFGTVKPPRKWIAPRPPSSAMRDGIGARVVVVAQLDERGNVRKAHALQTSLSKDLPHPRHFRKAYGEAMVAAVKKWKYEPVETLADRPNGGIVTIPIVMDVSRGISRETRKTRWRSFIPGPVVPPPWMSEQAALAAAAEAADSNDAQASITSFRLQRQVVGTTL